MSAFTVGSGHIDVLVNAALQYDMVSDDLDTLIALGDELWAENYASVNYRYDKTNESPDYDPRLISAPLAPEAVVKAVSCYDYQSCEHPQWHTSTAKAVVESIHRAAEARMPADMLELTPIPWAPKQLEPRYRLTDAYDALPWGFVSVEGATTEAVRGVSA